MAATERRWRQAAILYRRFLRGRPDDAAAWLQLGHALKEGGDPVTAESAYFETVRLRPDHAEAWFQLGHARRLLGDRASGIYCMVRALEADPGFSPAIVDLIRNGQRSLLPTVLQDAREGGEEPVFALERTEKWRRAFDIPPAPMCVLGEAIVATESDLTRGLHIKGPVVLLRSGVSLDPLAVDWLTYALERTGADLIYCDFMVGANEAWLHPMPDSLWFEDPANSPAAIIYRGNLAPGDNIRSLLQNSLAVGTVAHLPLPLATADAARVSDERFASRLSSDTSKIQVIIQTRDKADLLKACIDSLLKTAASLDLIELTIVDNLSSEETTLKFLEELQVAGIANIIPYSKSFNWAKANNIASIESNSPIILFLNNDTIVQSFGWDDYVRSNLAQPEIGALGALLLYTDQTIQHAGVVFGLNAGDPIHEGTGLNPVAGGPMGRWRKRRSVSAVTGAFMAVRREVFVETGGFDEELAVAFNDIDFCLAIRARGLRIVFDPRINSFHGESMTRGNFLDADAVLRDRAESRRIHARWGSALLEDPAYNPAWTREGQPFDGLRIPEVSQVIAWLDNSAGPNPWEVRNVDTPPIEARLC